MFAILFGQPPVITICGLDGGFALHGDAVPIFQECLKSIIEDEVNLMGGNDDDVADIRTVFRVNDKFMQAVSEGPWCMCDDPKCGGRKTRQTVLYKLEKYKGTVVYIIPFPVEGHTMYKKFVEYLNDGFDFDAAKELIKMEFATVTQEEIKKAKQSNG